MHDLGMWLDSIGLGECRALLAAHGIDRDTLRDLTDRDLERIGLSIGQRRKLLRAATGATDAASDEAGERVERRQVTVMFCDLADSTRLAMLLDPEDLRRVIGTFLSEVTVTVARFGGYVARYMGDGVLVYFGWPVAHEAAAEQAARAGLAVVEVARARVDGMALNVRIGIATGLVVVGDVTGTGTAREYMVIGEVPNLAARLQAVADPNTIVIAAPTRRLLGRLFDLEPVGPYVLKGVDGAVPAWRVLREHEGDIRFIALRVAARGGMVSRDAEISLLAELWRRAQGGAGQALLLRGEAGIGKTRIVEAFGDSLVGQPHLRFRYQCVPNHASSPLHPIIRGFRKAMGLTDLDTEETKHAKLRQLLIATGPISDNAVASFGAMLSLSSAPALPHDGDPQRGKARMLAGLVDYVAALAERQPLVLQFEDAQWSDPTSLDVCRLIIEQAASLPLLVIVSSRPEFVPTWKAASHITHRTVTRLERSQSAEMIRRILGGKGLPEVVSDHILTRADGVPLFTEELTLALLESGALNESGDRWTLNGPLAPFQIPATLQDSLTARLDRLGWAKPIAQMAAVIGRDFSPNLLAPVAGLPLARLKDALDRLCESELVVEHGSYPASTYTFRHALIQEAAYAGLLLSERRRLHAAIARILEAEFPHPAGSQPELLAHHYEEAHQPEQAVGWWRRAAKRSHQAMAHAEAAEQLGRCLAQLQMLPPTDGRDRLEAEIRFDLGMPLSVAI